MSESSPSVKGSTRNFRPESLLGVGGFGSVYKGWMDEHTLAPVKPGTGMIVAVKRLKLDSFQGHREWLVGAPALLLHLFDYKVVLICVCNNFVGCGKLPRAVVPP